MQKDDVFIFKGHAWDAKKRSATFSYQMRHGGEVFDFGEILEFPVSSSLKEPHPNSHLLGDGAIFLKNSLDNLLLILGISYYKLFCPKNIELSQIKLSKEQADFWNAVYTKGLGEFFYKN